jgi:DNA-binding beta-propeller fold protein YncE
VSGPVQTVYVSNGRGSTVTPIDTATNTPGPPVPIGRGPGLIAMAPDGRTAYVTSDESIVVPIDTATGTPGAPIRVGVTGPGLHDQPDGNAITPDGRTVYVANTWENTGRPASAPGTVTPIATATNTPGAPIEVGSQPWAFAITPDGRTAYVASWQSGTVTPIATATNTAGTQSRSAREPRQS